MNLSERVYGTENIDTSVSVESFSLLKYTVYFKGDERAGTVP